MDCGTRPPWTLAGTRLSFSLLNAECSGPACLGSSWVRQATSTFHSQSNGRPHFSTRLPGMRWRSATECSRANGDGNLATTARQLARGWLSCAVLLQLVSACLWRCIAFAVPPKKRGPEEGLPVLSLLPGRWAISPCRRRIRSWFRGLGGRPMSRSHVEGVAIAVPVPAVRGFCA